MRSENTAKRRIHEVREYRRSENTGGKRIQQVREYRMPSNTGGSGNTGGQKMQSENTEGHRIQEGGGRIHEVRQYRRAENIGSQRKPNIRKGKYSRKY
jgi:hypothetical protein